MDKNKYEDKYGHELVTDEQGLLTDLYTNQKYILGKDGKVHELKSPLDASPIYLNENGEYVSNYSDNKFTVDENGNVSALDESGNVIATYGDGELERMEESNTRITEMEENGTIDYYLEFKKYIRNFLDNNYPLSQEDLRSILQDRPTENAINRQETSRILNEAMGEILKEIAEENIQMLNGDISHVNESFQYRFFEKQQEMLKILWEKQHESEQEISEERPEAENNPSSTQIQEEQTIVEDENGLQEEQDISDTEQGYEPQESQAVSGGESETAEGQELSDGGEKIYNDVQESVPLQDNIQSQEALISSETKMETNARGQQLLDQVVEESKEIDVRTEEINDLNREIKQTERNYIQSQEKPQQDIESEVSIGE